MTDDLQINPSEKRCSIISHERDCLTEQRLVIVVSSASTYKLTCLPNRVEIDFFGRQGAILLNRSAKEDCLTQDGHAVAQEFKRFTTDENPKFLKADFTIFSQGSSRTKILANSMGSPWCWSAIGPRAATPGN